MTSPESGHPTLVDLSDEHFIERPVVRVEKTLPEIPADYVPEVLPYSGEKLTPTVHYEHAYQVLDTLMAAYNNNEYPYSLDRVKVPHHPDHMPKTLERGSREHAVFLFKVCYYMRGGTKSTDAVKALANIYDERPEFFDCSIAKDLEPEPIVEALTAQGLGFQQTVAKQWVENARRLHERYDGDPRKIFDEVATYEHSQALIQNDGKGGGFIGFKEKMTSMIIYYLMDDELIDEFVFPIPVDVHVMRVSVANEMITFGDTPHGTNLYVPEALGPLRKLYYDYAVDRNVDPRPLCSAVWLLSEALCGKSPGNITKEPLGRKNRDGRSTYLVPNVVDPEDFNQQKAYMKTCGSCAVENTCKLNIPGAQYYIAGGLIIRGKRIRFPQLL